MLCDGEQAIQAGLTGLTETLIYIFKQKNSTPGASSEEPPA